MRKNILIIFALFISTMALSRSKALGVRAFLWEYSISYQHYSAHKTDFIELNATFRNTDKPAGMFTAVYNMSISELHFKYKGTLNLYAGIGVGVGYSRSLSFYKYEKYGEERFGTAYTLGPDLYVPVQFGVEYKFKDLPLQISLDSRPYLGYHFCNLQDKIDATFNLMQAVLGLAPALGIRYQF